MISKEISGRSLLLFLLRKDGKESRPPYVLAFSSGMAREWAKEGLSLVSSSRTLLVVGRSTYGYQLALIFTKVSQEVNFGAVHN